ncbi:MAG TPA: hypothetical protein VML57_15865 [Burkholderiales bacterium]|jgi:hypothetical protein|nr:hypothetical protein [Burkholderiales bacterium]
MDGRGLQPGQSTVADVRAVMGEPAEKRAGPGGETVYWYPRLPYGRESYAARIDSEGKLIALEQRLTEENIAKVVRDRTTMQEVRDLLGPPFEPTKFARMQRDIWTYPMRIAGDLNPKWFIVQMSPDGVVRETYLMDDPQFQPKDTPFRRLP